MKTQLKAAVAQLCPSASVDAALARLADFAAKAAAQGAELLVFPEAYLGGYPRGSDFGAVVGSRSKEGRDEFRRYYEGAIELPGPACDELGRIAAELRLHLVGGVVERAGGTLYCTATFHAPDGRFLGKHRKLMPTAAERLVWGFGDGSTMPVFDTPIGRLGAVICWENMMPLLRAAYYAKGIELYCAPTADARDMSAVSMRHIAVEGRCFVLSANQFARKSHYPSVHGEVAGEADAVVSRGGSCIVDPFGRFLAGPDYEGECLLVAEIDRGEIARGKYDLDTSGHYARPDVFRLVVDETPKPPVVFVRSDDAT
jgi:nitrilase